MAVVAVAVLLTTCDALFHVGGNVLYYIRPMSGSLYPGQPTLEVFGLFFLMSIACVLSGLYFLRHVPCPSLTRCALSMATFILFYWLSGFWRKYPGALYYSFFMTWPVHVHLLFPQHWRELTLYSVLLGTVGPIGEGVMVKVGFFGYREAHIFFVPSWLSPFYFHGAVTMAAVCVQLWSARRR